MKKGIIIDGKQYELQEIQNKDEDKFDCDYCDLHSECNEFSCEINLCELLHHADKGQSYRYIGDIEDDKN